MKTALEIANEILNYDTGTPKWMGKLKAQSLAKAVVKLTEENEKLSAAHQKYWELQKDKEDIERDRARANEGLREAQEILEEINPGRKMSDTAGTLAVRIASYGKAAQGWLAKYGEKK